jgi:outer membrane protein OmpA-like peptidoglycan-associated protein
MQPRFAALLFLLGLADLAFLNLRVGPELFAHGLAQPSASSVQMAPERAAPSPAPSRSVSALSPALREASRLDAPKPPALGEKPTPPASEPSAEPAAPRSTLLQADLTVAFPDKASATLTPAAREELLELAQRLRDNPRQRLRIVGHADARGSRQFNHYLGSWRARAVSQLLESAGVPPDQVDITSRGEDEPLAEGASEEAWAANRRVEISIGSERRRAP